MTEAWVLPRTETQEGAPGLAKASVGLAPSTTIPSALAHSSWDDMRESQQGQSPREGMLV